MRRFPRQADKVDPGWQPPPETEEPPAVHEQDSEPWPDEDPALWDRTTRRAYEKQHGKLPG